MAKTRPDSTRIIQIKDGVIGPIEPRHRSVRSKSTSDYPEVPATYLEVVKLYASPLLFGPPICDELVAIVEHMFTEEEASLVQYIKSPLGKTAHAVAAAAGRPVEEVRPILDHLADEKGILLGYGRGNRKRYGLLPVVPGAFEYILIRTSLDTLTDWHRRFATLFEELYETGFLTDYAEYPFPPVVRYLPVGESIEAHPMALPSDRLERILDPYKRFAVGMCQCRMAEEIVGRGCGRPLENCIAFGDIAEYMVRKGRMRRVDRKTALEIKAEAEATGLVTWISEIHVGKHRIAASCSCCGCCCHALRTISEFNAPGMIAPPHFVPKPDLTECTYCGKCARACPMGATVVDTQNMSHHHLVERCIGCGLCAVACDKQQVIQMEPTPRYRKPSRHLLPTLLQGIPKYLRTAWSVWRKYR